MENASDQKIETAEELNETVETKHEEKNVENQKKDTSELNEKDKTDPINQNTDTLKPNDSEKKFMQDSFNFSIDKNLFSAPKYHPHFLLKNHTVQYMDPIIKKAKGKTFLCCC